MSRAWKSGLHQPVVVAGLSTILALAAGVGCSDDPNTTNPANASGGGNDAGLNLSDGFTFGDGGTMHGVGDGSGRGTPDLPMNRGQCEFAPKPDAGQPGATCAQPADCDSGLCVEGPDGKICTRTCIECCPNGFKCEQWNKSDADFICLPKLAALCRPCKTDAECAAVNEGALCVPAADDGAFCGGACTEAKDCPAGYACELAKGSQGEAKQCVRKAGACGCSVKSIADGAATWCSVANDTGTCKGERKCTSKGLSPCDATPAVAELCNGGDDDCDGDIDEDIAPKACEVAGNAGKCAGKETCVEGKAVCEGQTPSEEACDGLDNDCDGDTDESFPDLDADGTADCVDDDKDGDKTPNGKDCKPEDKAIHPGAIEVCNGVDDNCDGKTDEEGATGCKKYWIDGDQDGYGNLGQSKCLCGPDGDWSGSKSGDCNDGVKTIHPDAPEGCDGADNDCNGKTDEGFALGGACEDGTGACKVFGKMVCAADGKATACSAKGGNGGAEKCNGLDDDCNGKTDEPFTEIGQGCSAGKGACKANGKLVCAADGLALKCDAKLPPPGSESCNGQDDDCDGKIDENWPDKGKSCSVGVGGCKKTGQWVCAAGGGGLTCNATPGSKKSETCNNVDDDCDGKVDESLSQSCNNKCGSGKETCSAGKWQGCTAPKPKCTSGSCCDGCNYRPTSYKCGTKADKTTYQCSGSCGGKVRRYEHWRYCSGNSASCGTSNLKKLYKGIKQTCSGSQLCTNIGSTAYCKTCSGGCSSSKCNTQPVKVVCIDAGFGGSEPGAKGNGLVEKTLNLSFANHLKDWLNKDNTKSGGGTWKVVMTRTGDQTVSIPTRAAICNNAGAHRVVSIFTNSFGSSLAKGAETYHHSLASSTTKSYCLKLHNQVVQHSGNYNRGLKVGNYKILASVKASACLTLAGFISNGGDASKLKSDSWRREVAKGMLHGLQQSFGYAEYTP